MSSVQKSSAAAEDCLLAVQKAITKHIGGEVLSKESLPNVIVLNFSNGGKRQEEIAALLLKALTKVSCGSEKGVAKLPTGEVVVDSTVKLSSRLFSKAVTITNFSFDDLPVNKAGILSIAEATYIRHLRRHSDPAVYAITEFPKCLLSGFESRLDVCIAGFILFSLETLSGGRGEKLRIFVKCIDVVLSEMCSASFATKVLPKKWNQLDELEPHQVDGLLEDAQLAISDYWNDTEKDEHTRVEVTFLMSSVGSDLCSYYRKKVTAGGDAFRCERKLIEYALNSFDDWISACLKLTTIDWGAEWGRRYEDKPFRIVRDRLHAIVTLHELISEMNELLVSEHLHNYRTETLWNVFGDMDIFSSSPAIDKQWTVCLSAFYQRLEPLEHLCAAALKKFFTACSDLPPQVVLNEFETFHELMKRPIIATELIFERDNFLSKMGERLQAILIEFEHRSGGLEDEAILEDEDRRCQTGRFMPGVVNNIIWLRQLRHRIEEMLEISASILSDLRSTKDFEQSARKLLEDIEDYEQEVFRDWGRDVEGQSRTLTLDADAPLIEINDEGKVEVNYSERLVQLIKEVRIFASLNYRVPDRIQQIAKKGLEYYSKGLSLKQIANTYNGMTEDIIPSTQAMLLKPAVTFEKAITASGTNQLTWKGKEETDKFIRKLHVAARSLTDANRHLHKLHHEILLAVTELFGIDLHLSRHRWYSKVLAIREKIETSGFQNMDSWREYWDMQLYKALEAQYQYGLETLHETVEEIKADIVYDPDTGHAALRPSLGSIRQQYYQHLKDFITFPVRFQGCSGPVFFKDMPARNEQCIFSAMQHASQLFRKVQAELKRFTPMLVIGCCGKASNPTLEEIVAASLSEVQHWEQAIRLLKQKGKEINNEELFIKCGCITLCTAGIKGVVDEHLFKLTEALKQTLKQSAEKHLKSIEGYLTKVSQCLNSKLSQLEEIGEVNVQYSELIEQRPGKEVEFHHFFNKNVLLQNMTGSAGINFTETKEIWDTFMKRLDSHESEVEEKMNELRKSFKTNIKAWEKDVERLTNQWNEVKPKDINTKDPLNVLTQKQEETQRLKETGEKCAKHCQAFSLEEPDLHILTELESEIESYIAVWDLLKRFQEEYQALRQEPWISFSTKIYRFEDFVKRWQEALKETQAIPASVSTRTTLEEWVRCVPLLKYVRGDGFTPSHWSELFQILKLKNVTQDTVKFGEILDKHQTILLQEVPLKKLHSRAQGEAQIREALDDVRSWGTESRFDLTPYPGRSGLMLITEWKALLAVLSDQQALILTMKESPYFSIFANDVNRWEERLNILGEYLRYMSLIQRKWVYLEPIFRRGALPNEKQRFDRLDEQYVQIMKSVQQDSRLITLVSHKEYKGILSTVLEQLERCQKSLNQFLETKRDGFPRFYFISDDDLLEILAQSKNPTVIQSHLRKLFMGIYSVDFDLQNEHILRVQSLEGEVVPLTTQVRVTDEVEVWLSDLDKEMKSTLKTYLVNCVKKMDIGLHASQILCTAEMINFTRKTEEVIRDSEPEALQKHKSSMQVQLRELTAFAGSNTDPLVGIKLKSLIMDLIHNIDVVDQLITNKVSKLQDWIWRKQLRFYLDSNDFCVVRMVDTEVRHSYEYQGNLPKLVHTPLTDRCYLTLLQGMQLGYGGNPYGPAGTGKTESVKALGNLLGRQVLVFNCDEGIDFKSMGRTFTGLVKCGAWGCFDEFNRLKVDQLSAISQMIQVIQEALKNGDSRCNLLAREIDVNPNAGIFVTLNPAGKGYGGRSKLPDNLKQLFRSIAMSVPDNELIIQTILFSEGFENAKDLAKKTVEIFNLSKQLLSQQQHYDWGLRAMKSVLRLGGTLIHGLLMQRVAGKVKLTPEELLMRENEIIIKSLRVNTLAKLTFEDAILFNNLVSDIFPGVQVLEIDYEELRPAIEESLRELKLQLVEAQVQTILQLYETLQQRMGVVLVGPSGSGKSTLVKVLRKALQHLGKTVPMYVVNPKALPKDQLLGHMDPDTREWFDGVITAASKKIVKEEKEVQSWVFCDGDIDPEWVESLNSVLDDNKLLTMPNGVRVQFGNNVNFIFETHSLEHASPATVSRMGIIYLSEEHVDPKMTVASWLLDQPEEQRTDLGKWIEDYFYQAIESLLMTEKLVVQTTKMGLVMSALKQLQGCTSKAQFAIALIYGLGSYLSDEHRKDYAKDVLYLVGERAPDPKLPLDFRYEKTSGSYVPFHFDPSLDMTVDELYHYPMVATVDCQRALEVMQAWTRPIRQGVYCPFIIVGPEGCGKTMLLNNLLSGSTNTRVAVINCSAQTKAIHVMQKLKQTCQMLNSSNGKVLRPVDVERLVLLFKDLNLPKPDKYGTVQLHSFLQQLILYSGFYDSDLEWVAVERVQIVGTMNPPGSMGRYPVSTRFLAINSILCLSYPSKDSLNIIYSEFLNVVLKSERLKLNLPANKGAADVARVMTTVYDIISTRCTVDVASHYIFNPRDITKWVLNLMNYSSLDTSDIIGYEGRRIFVDRLVSSEERSKLTKLIRDNLAFLYGHSQDAQQSEKEVLCFVSWNDGAPIGKRKLMPTTINDLKKTVEVLLLNYSRENCDLNVQLIPEVCSWIARVDRVLSQERGNLLLVGRSGVGSAEIVRLVAYSNRTDLVTLNLTREYSLKHFYAELKSVMTKAGVEGLPVVLLLEDFNFFDPHFLETVNSLLSSGEVPGLFTAEEQDAMLGPLKEDAIGEGFTPYNYFIDRIARFLHIAVIMDPTNPQFEVQCRANPALFTHCNVYWMGTWETTSLKLIPRLLISDVYKSLESIASKKKDFNLTTELAYMHRYFGDTFSPQHFKALCQVYEHIFNFKNQQVVDSLARLKSGVNKLNEAQENVDKIAADVSRKKELLVVKQEEADEALKKIQGKMEEAGEQKRGIHKVQKELSKEQNAITERKTLIEEQLSNIQPVLDAALSSVSSIRSEHLTELKSLKQPPPAVQDVLEAVIVLIQGGNGIEKNWPSIRKILSGDIKGQILNYNIDAVNPTTRSEVQKVMESKANSFKREVIGRASKAAAPMAEWLKAVIQYSKVLETVAPLRDELREFEDNLQKGKDKKSKYEAKLEKLERTVEELRNKFGQKTTEAERLRSQLEQAEQLLNNATELLSKLGTEHQRWTMQMKTFDSDLDLLPSRCLLAAGFITYLGREDDSLRRKVLAEWGQTVNLPDFNFFTFLREESMQLHYKSQGLPGDELSMDNALIIQEQINTPLIEDPSGQAIVWLSNYLKDRKENVEVCSLSEERLVSALELALRFGKKFILTEVDHIEPFMYPILRKELHNEGTKKVISIGDRRSVDYADGFQLYLITRVSGMRIAPDILSYITPINFSITQSGLEGQFLSVTIQHEQPTLEKEKLSILAKEEQLKMQLADLEQTLLLDLANSKGSLLDNTSLIESLNRIKTQASEISEALDKSKLVQEELDAKRNVYRPFSTVASHIFFVTKTLKELSHMYQFSFKLFMDLFKRTLAQHKDLRTDPETKIAELQDTFIRLVVTCISRALLKEHRAVYAIHLSRALFPEQCVEAEWDFFIGKAVALESKTKEAVVPTFVFPDSVDTYRTFAALFPELIAKIHIHEADVWLQWMQSSTPEQNYPHFLKPLTHLQRLLIMKTLRGDRLIAAMNFVACKLLKVDSLDESDPIAGIEDAGDSSTPILLITTPGSDPSQELQAMAHKKVGKEHFHPLAMGSGQADEALRLIKLASARGDWVFLKNLHLVIPWVATLQKELHLLKPHDAFRLFLTTEAHDEFPLILLSHCAKVTYEAPPGMKQNLLRTYGEWEKNTYDSYEDHQKELLFIAAAFHGVIQERRLYVPQGWSKPYEVTASDMKSSADIILRQCRNKEIDWRSIRGLLENAIYGSKMETDYDWRILMTYIEKFFNASNLTRAKKQQPLFDNIYVPIGNKYTDYIKAIRALPESDVPSLFSLPPNADRVAQLSRVRQLFMDLQRINDVKVQSSMNREEWVARLQPVLDAWRQLTTSHTSLLSYNASVNTASIAPTKTIEHFISAEMVAVLRLVAVVDACVRDLQQVIEGGALLTEHRRAEAAYLIQGDLPPSWEGHFASSLRVLGWMQSLLKRAARIVHWQELALSGNLLKEPLDLAVLLRPRTFLNAFRQATAHALRRPLVALRLVATVSAPPPRAALTVALQGLLLQGAVLDTADVLQPITTPDEPAAFPLPKAFVAWMVEPPALDASVRVPVYVNSSKEDYVCDFELRCESELAAQQFVLSGVSILLVQ